MAEKFDPIALGAIPIEEEFDPIALGAIPIDEYEYIDRESGAPISVRGMLGVAKTPEDQMAVLSKYYEGVRQEPDGQISYMDPEYGQRRIANPEGLDFGDIAGAGREIAELFGGGLGATAAVIGGQTGPQVMTPEELVTVPAAAGASAAGAGALYDMIMRSAFDIPDSREALDVAFDEGTSFMANALGQGAGMLLEQGFKQGLRKAGTMTGKESAAEVKAAFDALGAQPTPGLISGSKTIQKIEDALLNLPMSTDILNRRQVEIIEGMDRFVKKTAENIAEGKSPEAIGSSLKSGIDTFVKKFNARGEELYDALWSKLPEGTRAPIENLKGTVDHLSGMFDADPAFKETLDSKSLNSIRKAIEESPEGVTVRTLKALRTKLGRELDDKVLLPDASQAEIKDLYGALTRDIEAAAEQAGAVAEYRAANEFWKAGRARIDDVLQPLVKSNDAGKIYRAVFGPASGTLKRETTPKIRQLMKSLPSEERADVVAEFVRRMGQRKSGAMGADEIEFSPAEFLTQYNKMKREGLDKVVFGSVKGLPDALENLSITSAAFKDTAAAKNPSGTAQALAAQGFLNPTNWKNTTKGIGVTLPVGKLFASARFVNWLAGAQKEIARNPNSIPVVLSRLSAIAELEPEMEGPIAAYLESLEGMAQPSP